MDDVLHFEKGSSGYSAPGPLGLSGDKGTNSHFSAYNITDSTDASTIVYRIRNRKCLSNNDTVITEEKYNKGDIIIDQYGNVGVLKNTDDSTITTTDIVYIGNMIFYNIPAYTSDSDPESVPPGNTIELKFDVPQYLSTIDLEDSIMSYMCHSVNDTIENGSRSPMWHHRWNLSQYALSYELTPNDTDYVVKISNMPFTYTTLEFIKSMLRESNVSKICCVFSNGLSYEKVFKKGVYTNNDIYIKIPVNYFDTTYDASCTYGGSVYANMGDEIHNTNYRDFILNQTSCRLYFEYTYKSKNYRLNIKCQ